MTACLLPLLALMLFTNYLAFSNKKYASLWQPNYRPAWMESKWKCLIVDWLVILALWMPSEFKLMHLFASPGEHLQILIWKVDKYEVLNELFKFFSLNAGLVWFLGFRKLEINYHLWSSKLVNWLWAILIFLLAAPFLLDYGEKSGFITVINHEELLANWTLLKALPTFFLIFFIVATLEEIFFRGIMQNISAPTIKDIFSKFFNNQTTITLFTNLTTNLISAVIFGLAHLNGGDWRYMILASVAGFAYGLAYQITKSIFPAAIVHTLVDLTWVLTFFTPTPKN